MVETNRTTYGEAVPLDDSGGWVLEEPDAVRIFVRRLGSDVLGASLVVSLDKGFRVVGCDLLAHQGEESDGLTAHRVIAAVMETGGTQFILVRVRSHADWKPTRLERVVARIVGLAASTAGIRLVDHVVVATSGNSWSAWAEGEVDW